jgi:hypothetical protein
MAKKNRWNPASRVNCNHLTGMLLKGDDAYRDFVSRAFSAAPEEFEAIVQEGLDWGYFTSDNRDALLGTGPSTAAISEAAAGNAQATMISGLANAGQHSAVASLVAAGTCTQDQVDQVYGALELDYAALIAPPAPKAPKAKKAAK